ncbi:MAG: hypothetical protein B7Z66_08400 [Chromatiales bacterium 21-64-14]|nr:MAG: hypothetical protein B7Z66_08400 [Chromatiales bacterium 21-64-14]HQU15356.1 hypothetical protein [Gammaproteobacteria bacterium]
MGLPPADIHLLADALRDAVDEVVEIYEQDAPPATGQVTPKLLAEAAGQLIEILKRIDSDHNADTPPLDPDPHPPGPASEEDLSQLADYGLSLLGDLAAWAERLGVQDRKRDLELLAFPLALWVTRHGGELRTMEPVVNAVAVLANQSKDNRALEELYGATGELIDAAALTIRQDLEKGNPGRPWRVLNLNRAIIATRTHNPRIMEQAFGTLVQNLPEDAPAFFREGMGQMDALDYPAPVRAVMERYYRRWCLQHTLH